MVRKYPNKKRIADLFVKSSFITFYLIFFIFASNESYLDLQQNIKELKKKINNVKKEIKKVKKKIETDSREYSEYTNLYTKHFSMQKAEIDSLKKDYAQFNRISDSLIQDIRKIRNKQREMGLQQDRFRVLLISACERINDELRLFPQESVKNYSSAIDFIHGELKTKAIDNIEALERLWQILSSLSESGELIETFSGRSPVPYISGEVNFIRLGYAYLALVNDNASAGALWIPYSDSTGGRWEKLEKPEQIAVLKKCIRIRQGGAVPEIIELPFKHPIEDDALEQKGGNK